MRLRVMRTFSQVGEEPRTPEAGMAQTVQDMDNAGVERAVLQASVSYYLDRGQLDSRVAEHYEIISQHPSRFTHVGTILPPRQGPASYWDLLENPRILAEHVEKYAIQGVHILPSPWVTPPNDKWFSPLYAKCIELNLVVFSLHRHARTPVAHLPQLSPPPRRRGHRLPRPGHRRPPHRRPLGRDDDPPRRQARQPLHRHLRLVTPPLPHRTPGVHARKMAPASAGADKVLFGTDYPLLNIGKAVHDARNLDLPDHVMEKFMYANTNRLLPAG